MIKIDAIRGTRILTGLCLVSASLLMAVPTSASAAEGVYEVYPGTPYGTFLPVDLSLYNQLVVYGGDFVQVMPTPETGNPLTVTVHVKEVTLPPDNAVQNADGSWTVPEGSADFPLGLTGTYADYEGYTGEAFAVDFFLRLEDRLFIETAGSTANPPEITAIDISPTPLGSVTTVTATFEDEDSDGGSYTATIDWGGGGTVVEEVAVGDGDITGSFQYAATGVYTVKVTITDEADRVVSSSAYAAVYDATSGSLVTGLGWIPDENVGGGKTYFGFLCTQWGSNAGGYVRVRWGENRFCASAIDYVVADESGDYAWFAGIGSINGAGEYYFMVDVSEATDEIWIDIWPDVTEGYNTGGLVALGQGAIRIRMYDWN